MVNETAEYYVTAEGKMGLKIEKPPRKPNNQEMIVRQSSLNRAIDLVNGEKINLDMVLDKAEEFEQWVMREVVEND
jgi:hypothetical protein|tara:strand:- start:5185 stop:5412 length:228 start_codon:yes stop_codon:yes gene_type:complete